MKEKIFVSSVSYDKAKDTFEELNLKSNFQFIPVNEEEKALAEEITKNQVKAFIADIYPYKKELYDALPKGGIIARYGVGYDSIDVKQASSKNLLVCNTPGVLDNAVAEHSVWLMGCCARSVHSSHMTTKAGYWHPQQGIELRGRNVTLMGFGRIAQSLSKKLSFGFEMNVTAVDIFSRDEFCQKSNTSWQELQKETGVQNYTTDFKEGLQNADFVVTLMAVVPQTKHIVNEQFLSAMKKEAFLINPARGALVDEIALFDALSDKKIAGAALDVFEIEAYKPQHPQKDLRKLDNILMTPHIASNTKESNRSMATQAATNIINILEKGVQSCPFIVNH